jgi:ADP-ribosylglycohydrolase
MNRDYVIKRSALWAAYGDALGFITELVDESGLKRRIGKTSIEHTIAWKRVLGGKFGTQVNLPAGAYSDDTQLRLATSRSINGNGNFDVESFAKIELPIWLSYSLGGGRGTKNAAQSLISSNVNWFSNFYGKQENKYFSSGGNGAAMRVQPHVWSQYLHGNINAILEDVIKNSICTHGHPRAILGAAFHALSLYRALSDLKIPGPNEWSWIILQLNLVAEIISNNSELSAFWIPMLEEFAGEKVDLYFKKYIDELAQEIRLALELEHEPTSDDYHKILDNLDAFNPIHRGSGAKTSVAASILAWLYRNKPAEYAIKSACNALGSDTDTIATMTGAIMGAVESTEPQYALCDREYINQESNRLFLISTRSIAPSFSYPDFNQWKSPKSQLEAVIQSGEDLFIPGLGKVEPIGDMYLSRAKDHGWQWLKTTFDQTLICKRKVDPTVKNIENKNNNSPNLFSISQSEKIEVSTPRKSLDELTKEVINSGFSEILAGKHLLSFSDDVDGIEKAIAYTAIVLKARMARNKTLKNTD